MTSVSEEKSVLNPEHGGSIFLRNKGSVLNIIYSVTSSNSTMLLPPSELRNSCCYLHQNIKPRAATSIRTSNLVLLSLSEPETSCCYLHQNSKPHAATSIRTSNFTVLPPSEPQTSCCHLYRNLKPCVLCTFSQMSSGSVVQ